MRKLTTTICLTLAVLLGGEVRGSDLPPCPSDQTKRQHNCFASITDRNGGKYVGEVRNNKAHGQGTYTYGPSSQWAGDKYVGEYRNGKRHGQGTYTFVNGNKYVGEFRDNKFHGQGTYTFANGSVWKEGIWKNN